MCVLASYVVRLLPTYPGLDLDPAYLARKHSLLPSFQPYISAVNPSNLYTSRVVLCNITTTLFADHVLGSITSRKLFFPGIRAVRILSLSVCYVLVRVRVFEHRISAKFRRIQI